MRLLAKFLAIASLSVATTASAAETIKYTYDARGRVIAVKRTGTINNNVNRTYEIDKANNRTKKTTTVPPPP